MNKIFPFSLALLIVPTILFLSSNTSLADSAADKKLLFQKAQATFNQAQMLRGNERRLAMLKAASQFEALVKEHDIKNGYLLYNIGNAYFEAGEEGKAILNYKRAERLVPGFSDLRSNLNSVRQILNTPEAQKTWWGDIVKSVFFWHYMFDYSTRRSASAIVFVLFWFCLSLMVLYKFGILKALTVLLAVATIALGGSYLKSSFELNVETAGVVIKQQTMVRKGPGTSYEPMYSQPISEGTEFRLLEVQGEWWRIKLANDDEVWIKAIEAELI
ncbi:MAG: hypothetical protein MJE63_19170 [Proteobacteria bacterium]|nr:hypothetical protein [Pseudomonadota bacterium]